MVKNDRWIKEMARKGMIEPFDGKPMKKGIISYGVSSYGYYTIPQAEPNGLYTNTVTSSATWILTTDADGNIKPTYVESEITVSQSKIDARLCEDWSLPDDYSNNK